MADTNGLIEQLEKVREEARALVESRWQEFETLRKTGNEEELFAELSFCVLTANWSAQGGMKAQKIIGKGFANLPKDELTKMLVDVGHRYPQVRAEYIVSNRWIISQLRTLIEEPDPREFFVKNVKGLGWKESSHFLRNVAFRDYAILDKHMLRVMLQYELIDEIPKGWTKKKYLDYEERLKNVAEGFGECLGKLDLYLWYMIKHTVDK
ncbi:MAG TPA: N-glycosylase/DNA lyase [Fervidobacterium sp.]|nr:N-glycosylase/DNA lyase [Fervidobacterium sp.]HOM73671.1 N-glycosylase/DNA lyase [Fervidobacterium sp.]HPP17340.1 N-glycosylase/DNA lyase [Fervidobacterium sp.]